MTHPPVHVPSGDVPSGRAPAAAAPRGPVRPRREPGLFRRPDRLPGRLAELVAQAERVAHLRVGPFRIALVADPALARTVLTLPAGTTQGRGLQALRLTLGKGLLTSVEPLHMRQRRLVQPAFHPGRLTRYAQDAVRAATERSAGWTAGRRIDLAAEMSSLTLDVVGRTLFGTDLREDAAEVAAAQSCLLADFPKLMRPRGMIAAELPTPLRHRMRTATARLDAVVARVVAARRLTGDTGDVLSMLLAARDPDTGEPMPAQQLRDEVLTLLLAGHETTAVALSWAWWELGRHPEVRAALDRELAGDQARRAIRDADWERLPFTRAVFAETLRLHPPAYVLSRLASTDLDLGGHPVPRGTGIMVSPYALHRDPRSWPDAARWDPSRWLTADGTFDESAPGQPRGAYLPFGAGPRICIGAGFATMEAVLLLAVLASAWRPVTDPDAHPGELPAVTLRPRGGIPAVLTPAALVPA